MTKDPNCIFCKIVDGAIPCTKIHEDDEILAFRDIHPLAPIHFLIIPKIHIESLSNCDDSHREVLGRILAVSGRLAAAEGANDGFRTIINTGRVGGQEVYHLHAHILAGQDRLPRMLSKS
ncbi:MAG: histidine triad nucleotide-binding protein [Burkholderiales bacterium]